jgi:hypothetical protein
MIEFYLDLLESGHVRGEALDVMNNLLRQCTQVQFLKSSTKIITTIFKGNSYSCLLYNY